MSRCEPQVHGGATLNRWKEEKKDWVTHCHWAEMCNFATREDIWTSQKYLKRTILVAAIAGLWTIGPTGFPHRGRTHVPVRDGISSWMARVSSQSKLRWRDRCSELAFRV
jgi:hypothetical protein